MKTRNNRRAQRARQRMAMVEAFFASDQSQAQLCRQNDINDATFQYWLKKYRHARRIPTVQAVQQPMLASYRSDFRGPRCRHRSVPDVAAYSCGATSRCT